MPNKKTLSLKTKPIQLPPPDAPFTPVDQTVRTPGEPPNGTSYFAASSLYTHPHANESDDILTDVDEPSGRAMRNYSVSFTPVFDLLMMTIYSHILSLPTTTPFLGVIPPLGLVSRVANETIHSLIKSTADGGGPLYDAQCMLSHDHLKSHAFQPIILQLIRRRLLDLCAIQQRPANQPNALPQVTSVLVPVPLAGSVTPNFVPTGAVYSGLGLRQLSLSNLLLTEQNVLSIQAQPAPVAALSNSRLRLSSLSLRKHSLTRNNSYTGLTWLHVGNVQNVRPNALGMNLELGASTDSLQLMHDFVPQAFIARLGNLLANLAQSSGNWCPAPGFNSMMLDYQTPPSSAKSSILLGSTPPSATSHRDVFMAGGDFDELTNPLMRLHSANRAGGAGAFPKPLTINTDFLLTMNATGHGPHSAVHGSDVGALNSPFISATTPSEDVGYFGNGNVSGGNVLPGFAMRSGPLIAESPGKDTPMTNGSNKINLPGQFSLSEKKRDSLKLKRGIH